MTQYAIPLEPLLSSSEGMERVTSSLSDEVKAVKMAVNASIFDQEFAMLKGASTGVRSWRGASLRNTGSFIEDEDLKTIALDSWCSRTSLGVAHVPRHAVGSPLLSEQAKNRTQDVYSCHPLQANASRMFKFSAKASCGLNTIVGRHAMGKGLPKANACHPI